MTTAAEKVKEKEKAGMRRALGRGLESLLPGPRRVSTELRAPSSQSDGEGPRVVAAGTVAPLDRLGAGSSALGSSAAHVQGGGAAGETEISRFARDVSAVEGIQAVVEDAAESPLLAKETRNGAPGDTEIPRFARDDNDGSAVESIQTVVEDSDTAELRSGWTGESPVPTQAIPTQSPVPTRSPVPMRAGVPAPHEHHESISIQAQAEGRTPSNLVVNIPLDHIDKNPYQTRYLFDEEMLKELAASIQANGVVQPVVVRPAEHGRYVLILGERRCRASKMAGKTSIPAIVRRVSDQQAAEMTIVENLQREDLNCMEQAEAFRVLSQEFKLTQQQIGERVGMSRESVSNYMRLLRLPETVMEYLATDKLTFSDARELMMLEDPKLVAKAADIAVKKHLSIEKIEDLVMELQGLGPERPGPNRHGPRWVDPNVKAAQSELERLLGVRVRIRDRRGKGKIIIEYATVDDYERVVEALRRK